MNLVEHQRRMRQMDGYVQRLSDHQQWMRAVVSNPRHPIAAAVAQLLGARAH